MELKGKHNVETDPVTLWNMLMDVEILPKIKKQQIRTGKNFRIGGSSRKNLFQHITNRI